MGKPPGGGSGEGIESLGVHVLTTEMGSANHARGLRTQITGAKWRISGRVQVGVLSTMCHCAGGGGSWKGEWASALARSAAESLCAPMCRSSLNNRVLGAELFCLYAAVGLSVCSCGSCLSTADLSEVGTTWVRR